MNASPPSSPSASSPTLTVPPELIQPKLPQAEAGEYRTALAATDTPTIAEPEVFTPEKSERRIATVSRRAADLLPRANPTASGEAAAVESSVNDDIVVPTQIISNEVTPSRPESTDVNIAPPPAMRDRAGAADIAQERAPLAPSPIPSTPQTAPASEFAPPTSTTTPTAPTAAEAIQEPKLGAPKPPKIVQPKTASPEPERFTTPEKPAPPPTTKNAQAIPLVGSTVFNDSDVEDILNTTNREPEQVKQAAQRITQRYMQKGYINSRAVAERTPSGYYQIRAIEGGVEAIRVEGNQRLSDRFIQSRIAPGVQTPLNSGLLEQELRLLRLNPLFEQVEASLRRGTQAGKSILVVRVKEATPWTGGVSLDNYSPPSVGSERISADLATRNLTGNGDELGGVYSRSLNGGAESYGVSYAIPLSAQENRLQLRFERNRNVVKQAPFDALGIRGDSELYEISYRHPIVRTLKKEFALSLGLTAQNGQTFTFNTLPTPFGIGPDTDGVSRTSVIKFGQEYVERDGRGTWNLRSQLNFGTGLFGATRNSGDIPDGQFVSWNAQAQRTQRLGRRHLLVAQAELQLTPGSLLPAQQFVLGGAQSVRGYRQNARIGDNGLRLSVEDRISLSQDDDGNPTFQIAPFIEAGVVWNHPDNPNPRPQENTLVTAGLGFVLTPSKNFQARLDYGVPLVNLDDRGNNIQDSGLHFRLNYRF